MYIRQVYRMSFRKQPRVGALVGVGKLRGKLRGRVRQSMFLPSSSYFSLSSSSVVKLTNSKTTIAVSVSVILVAVVVICTVLGLYLYKKRKTKREMEEASQQGMSSSSDPLLTSPSWRFLPLTSTYTFRDTKLMIDHMMAQRDWEY